MSIALKGFLIAVLCVVFSSHLLAQNPNSTTVSGQDPNRRVIITAVPFLTIAPDPRAAAMGDVGVATAPNANSIHWNPAKIAFINKDLGFALSYTPWLNKLTDDMSISYLSGFKKIDDLQGFGLALTYFDLGDIDLTDGVGNPLGISSPREFAITSSYSRKLSDKLGIGVSGRFISSNISGNLTSPSNTDPKPGTSIAADLGVYYTNEDFQFSKKPAILSLGASISNIGSKISYNSAEDKDFIPTNLKLGAALTSLLDPYNKITVALDFNKLMVPTPQPDGSERDKSLISGIFGSFGDAPDGFSEELKEVIVSTGVEYSYNDKFFIRAGYFFEHEEKGNRKYFTTGVGFQLDKLGFDFAYLIPQVIGHPLAETLRFGLTFSVDK